MVTWHEIRLDELEWYILRAFEYDYDLIDKYHYVNGSLEGCIVSTMTEIQKVVAQGDKWTFYALYVEEIGYPLGFTVVADHVVLSFGLSILHRTKEVVLEWWKTLTELMHGEFVTWIFKKNIRTLQFLERNGMSWIEDHGEYVTLLYLSEPAKK